MTVCVLYCGTATLLGDRHPITSPCMLQSSQHSLRVLRRVGYSGFNLPRSGLVQQAPRVGRQLLAISYVARSSLPATQGLR
jgi:hypothetical protein